MIEPKNVSTKTMIYLGTYEFKMLNADKITYKEQFMNADSE